MAEGTGSEQLEKRVNTPEPDPIADRSFSMPLLLFSLLMIGTLVWALYDEVVGQRPWKDLQSDFVNRYSRRLNRIKPQQKNAEAEIKQSDEYQQLNARGGGGREVGQNSRHRDTKANLSDRCSGKRDHGAFPERARLDRREELRNGDDSEREREEFYPQ